MVDRALQWLLNNNIYYHGNHISINHNTLAHPPQDGTLSDIATVALEGQEDSDQPAVDELVPNEPHLTQSFVTVATHSITEQIVRHSVEQRQCSQPTLTQSTTLMWPSIGGTPINEFTTERYFSCASTNSLHHRSS